MFTYAGTRVSRESHNVTLPVSVGGGATKRGDDAVVSVSGVAVTTAESLSS